MFNIKLLRNINKIYFLQHGFLCKSTRSCSKLESQNIPKNEFQSQDEIGSALEIEANLFENSSNNFKPAIAADLLNSYKRRNPRKLPMLGDKTPTTYRLPQSNKYTSKESVVIDDSQLGLEFTRLRTNDAILSKLITTIRSRKRRDENKQIIIEGRRLILDALSCGLKLQYLIFSKIKQLEIIKKNFAVGQKVNGAKIYKISEHDLKTWSTLTTPPGVLAIFERPSVEGIHFSESNLLPITVVCDNIREPNNLGSIIRICAAIPCYQVIVTKGCCDPWDTKALRGGSGGQFRVNIHDDVEWQHIYQHIPQLEAENCTIFVAENNIEKIHDFRFLNKEKNHFLPYSNITHVGSHNVIIIGGETHGVSSDAYKFLDDADKGHFLHIPLAQGVDSLNTSSALTLILFEIKKRVSNHI